jgi:hypothetical protein
VEASSTFGGVKKVSLIRASVEAETAAPAAAKKHSRKNEEGVIVNTYKPKTPYIGKCLLNSKIVGDDAPGETWHMVFSTEGKNESAHFTNAEGAFVKLDTCSICLKGLTDNLHCESNVMSIIRQVL